jgi:hypothetical protein
MPDPIADTAAPAASTPAVPATAPAAPAVSAPAAPVAPGPDPTTIRLASVAPLFHTGGFDLSKKWSSFKLADLTAKQVATLRTRVGRWIRVYPTDTAKLDGFLEHYTPPAPAAPAPTATEAAKAADPKAAKAGKKG